MAKVAFSKLNLKVNNEEVPVQIGEQTIAVKQYLPLEDKLHLIERVIEYAHDTGNNFANPMKTDVYMAIEIIREYTNINFTDKQLENVPELYDKVISSGIWATIRDAIPEVEVSEIVRGVYRTSDAFYAYRNSILGILENITKDYENTDLDVMNIKEKLNDPQTMAMINSLLTKLN